MHRLFWRSGAAPGPVRLFCPVCGDEFEIDWAEWQQLRLLAPDARCTEQQTPDPAAQRDDLFANALPALRAATVSALQRGPTEQFADTLAAAIEALADGVQRRRSTEAWRNACDLFAQCRLTSHEYNPFLSAPHNLIAAASTTEALHALGHLRRQCNFTLRGHHQETIYQWNDLGCLTSQERHRHLTNEQLAEWAVKRTTYRWLPDPHPPLSHPPSTV